MAYAFPSDSTFPNRIRERALDLPRYDASREFPNYTPAERADAGRRVDGVCVLDDTYTLGERCAEAYRQADALHYEAMALLAEFDERRGWEDSGFGFDRRVVGLADRHQTRRGS